MSRMRRWSSFWSWFDVYRSTFDKDMRKNDFLHFLSRPSYSCPALYLQKFLSLSYFEKIGSTGQTDGQV